MKAVLLLTVGFLLAVAPMPAAVPEGQVLIDGNVALLLIRIARAPIPELSATAPDVSGWFILGVSSTDQETTAYKVTVLFESSGVVSSQTLAIPVRSISGTREYWSDTLFKLPPTAHIQSVLVNELIAKSSAQFK